MFFIQAANYESQLAAVPRGGEGGADDAAEAEVGRLKSVIEDLGTFCCQLRASRHAMYSIRSIFFLLFFKVWCL